MQTVSMLKKQAQRTRLVLILIRKRLMQVARQRVAANQNRFTSQEGAVLLQHLYPHGLKC